MLDKIILHETLGPLIRLCCQENGMAVDVDECLIKNDLLDNEKIIILKIDEYYSSSRMHNPPPSIDCLIIVRCDDESYKFYLIELRDVCNTNGVKPREMLPKFETVVNHFFNEYADVFYNDSYKIKDVKAWVVTDALGTRNMSEEQYRRKIKGTVIEQYSLIKPLKVKNKLAQIEVVSPRQAHPIPNITKC